MNFISTLLNLPNGENEKRDASYRLAASKNEFSASAEASAAVVIEFSPPYEVWMHSRI